MDPDNALVIPTFVQGLDKLLAVGKAKVVVRAHIEHVLRLGGVYARLLGVVIMRSFL